MARFGRSQRSFFAPDADPPRLLVAEDDIMLLRFLEQGLSAAGFEVVGAADGQEALDAITQRGPFDALLLDEEMPRYTGRDILRRLRGVGNGVPAVIFSGSLSLSESEQAALGVGPVIRKPCSLAGLVEVLCETLAHQAGSSVASGRVAVPSPLHG
jgi:DNA-binding response OmpR family regulator